MRAVEPRSLLHFAVNLLAVVAGLHAAGWVHCDIKPENCVNTADGVVLLDLELATRRKPLPEMGTGKLFVA